MVNTKHSKAYNLLMSTLGSKNDAMSEVVEEHLKLGLPDSALEMLKSNKDLHDPRLVLSKDESASLRDRYINEMIPKK